MEGARREPVWSGFLTTPLATRIPDTRRPATLVAIKALHSAVFFSVAALILLVAWDGVRGRPGRRTGAALGVALAETVVYASNNQVCPLTPLAEELGAASGTVTDIYLPDWLSRRIPILSGGTLVVGLVLNLRAWLGVRHGGEAYE
jgi:hypothetical protein